MAYYDACISKMFDCSVDSSNPDSPDFKQIYVTVGVVFLAAPPRRGEVITIHDGIAAENESAITPLSQASFIVEQVVYNVVDQRDTPAADKSIPRHRIYVSLLDEQGRVVPYHRGSIPGIRITEEPFHSTDENKHKGASDQHAQSKADGVVSDAAAADQKNGGNAGKHSSEYYRNWD